MKSAEESYDGIYHNHNSIIYELPVVQTVSWIINIQQVSFNLIWIHYTQKWNTDKQPLSEVMKLR